MKLDHSWGDGKTSNWNPSGIKSPVTCLCRFSTFLYTVINSLNPNIISPFKSFPTHIAEVLPDHSVCSSIVYLSVSVCQPRLYRCTICLRQRSDHGPTKARAKESAKADVTAVCWHIKHRVGPSRLGKHARTRRRVQKWESKWCESTCVCPYWQMY